MENTLRQLQLAQIEILTEIDALCRAKGIHYSLYAGTLLGAVRHKGFIPWDDDLDICMSRADYNKFLDSWKDTEHPGFLIQNKENAPDFSQSFTKIRKDHTAFWQSGEPNNKYHIGIFVDIFPIDRMPNRKIGKFIFQGRCIIYQVLTREYLPINGSKLEKALTSVILSLVPKKRRPFRRQQLMKKITARDTDTSLNTVAIEVLSTIKKPLPSDLMDEFVELEFDGKQFMSIKKWDEYLTLKYHDYMQLPPEKDRVWKHKPLCIDFEHNYDEVER